MHGIRLESDLGKLIEERSIILPSTMHYDMSRPAAFFITVTLLAITSSTTTAFTGLVKSSRTCQRAKAITILSAKWDENDGKSSGGLGKPGYNNDALYNFHMMTQAQKIRDYSAMDTYVDTNSLWNLAWHDSFVRNGLSDFVPPLTDNLNVLVVGGRSGAAQLPVDVVKGISDEEEADSSTATTTETIMAPIAAATEEAANAQDSSCSFLASVFDDGKESDNNSDEDGLSNRGGELTKISSPAPMYDCIMDQGLIADLCASAGDNREAIARLLLEASKRIRDMGIYVANTPPLSDETKDYLTKLGKLLGLQWEFDLDGISDSNLCVSVARKYFKDELPSVGKLANIE